MSDLYTTCVCRISICETDSVYSDCRARHAAAEKFVGGVCSGGAAAGAQSALACRRGRFVSISLNGATRFVAGAELADPRLPSALSFGPREKVSAGCPRPGSSLTHEDRQYRFSKLLLARYR